MWTGTLTAILALLICGTVIADESKAPPAGGTPVLPADPLAAARVQGSQRDLATAAMVDLADQPGAQALRISTQPGATQPWHTQLTVNTTAPIRQGDVLLGRFRMRCTESMTGEGSVGFVFEQNRPDFEKSADMRLTAGRQWVDHFVPFTARRDFAAGEAQLCLRVGYDRQTVEIADLSVINYGQTVRIDDLPKSRITYRGREPDAPWRQAALDRIEQIRKGDFIITITDTAGRPVPGAEVQMKLRRHRFGFGVAIDAEAIVGNSPDDQKYREIILSLFNRAVFGNDMKWYSTWNGISAQTDQAVAWLREHGIDIRGHTLMWPSWRWSPGGLREFRDDPDEIRRRVNDHITLMASHFRGKLIHWDVVNEPYSEHDIIDLLGGRQVMVDWFKLARQADPDARLYLNDYGIFDSGHGANAHADHFYETIAFLQASGAPIGGIGIQSHFASDLPPPEALLKTLDRFASFGLPIEATEVSLDLDDRELQADYFRDYMITLFSHPSVEGIVQWGFWTKRHWRPEGAFWDDDWNVRPHGQVLIDLLTRQWTTAATVTADEQGTARVRGFYGTYDVEVSAGGRRATMTAECPADGAQVRVVVQ